MSEPAPSEPPATPPAPGAVTPVQLLTIAEACRRLGVSRSFFYDLASAELITLLKLGGASRVRSDAIDQLIENLPVITIARRIRR